MRGSKNVSLLLFYIHKFCILFLKLSEIFPVYFSEIFLASGIVGNISHQSMMLKDLESNNSSVVKNFLISHSKFRNVQTFLQAVKSSNPEIIKSFYKVCQDPSFAKNQYCLFAFQEALNHKTQSKQVIEVLLDLGFDPKFVTCQKKLSFTGSPAIDSARVMKS